jgi:DNA primase
MIIPLDFYELIRNQVTLSEIIRQKIILTKKSRTYLGLCPFHQEKTPSFSVNDIKKFYYCFGCGAHGDVIKFISIMSGLSYKDASIKLAIDHNIELPKVSAQQTKLHEESDQIFCILEQAREFFQSELTTEALRYLEQRNIDMNIIKEFDIGFAPSGDKLQKFFTKKSISLAQLAKAGLIGKRENGNIYEIFHNRIIFSIRNIYNKIVGFGGRVLNGAMPKYLNSPETLVFKKNEVLYGEDKSIASSYKKNYTILVEGYMDVIRLHSAGFSESVASLGTSVTENQILKLWRTSDEIILCLDGDASGIKASNRIVNLALPLVNSDKKISFITLPPFSDPDNIIMNKGKDFFQNLIDTRISLSEMIWKIEYSDGHFTNAEEKATIETKLINYCIKIKDHSLRSNYRRFFKDQIWHHLIKNVGFKKTTKHNILLTTKSNYSEIERLEYAFCTILIQFPDIIKNEDARNFLLTMHLENVDLCNFRDWFFEVSALNEMSQIQNIKELVEKTKFYDIFLLLSKTDNEFLPTSCNKVIDYTLIWTKLLSQYYLVTLRQEYDLAMRNMLDNELIKTKLYSKEIHDACKERNRLDESFTN